MRLIPAAFVAALAVAPAFAQTFDPASMQQGLNMLQTQLQIGLTQHGVTGVDVGALSLGQVVDITRVIDETQDSLEIRKQIEAIASRG